MIFIYELWITLNERPKHVDLPKKKNEDLQKNREENKNRGYP